MFYVRVQPTSKRSRRHTHRMLYPPSSPRSSAG